MRLQQPRLAAAPFGGRSGIAPGARGNIQFPTVDQDATFGKLHDAGFLDGLYQARELIFRRQIVLAAEDGTKVGFDPRYFVVGPVTGCRTSSIPRLALGKTYNAPITTMKTVEDRNLPFRARLPLIQMDAITNTFTP